MWFESHQLSWLMAFLYKRNKLLLDIKNRRKTLKKTKNHNVRNIVLALLSVLLLLVLIFFGSQNFIQKKLNSASGHIPTLNMAVVNEDNGTTYRGKKYLLAKSYLNGLKLPKNVSMDVVPRGVAESGLKNNSYQLAIFIPTDFSAKIVDVDNPNPQKLNIQYKINAKSQAMKSRCHGEADDIIQGLNRKLVSIYDLGIMSNLFDAQNKVAGIYARQGTLAAIYRNGLAEPISNLSQGFPDLQEGTKSLLSESQAYQQAQKQANQAAALSEAAQAKSEKDNLTKIMQQQAKNNQNKAELAKSMMQTSESTDDQIPQEINALNNQNKQLNQGIGDSKNDAASQLQKDFEAYSKGYEEEINTIKKALQSTNGQLDPDEVKNEIDHQKSPDTSVTNPIKQSSSSQSSQANESTTTLGEYLQNNDKNLYDQLMNLSKADDLNDLYEPLPFNNKISDQAKDVLSSEEYKQIKNNIDSINYYNRQLKDEGADPKFNGNRDEVSSFNDLYDKLAKKENENNTEPQTQKIVLNNLKNVSQDQFEVTVPNKVTVVNLVAQKIENNKYRVSPGDASEITLELRYRPVDLKNEDSTVTVTYNHKEDAPQKVTISNQTTQQVVETVEPQKQDQNKNQNQVSQTSQSNSQQQNQNNNQNQANNAAAKTENQPKTTFQTQNISNDKDRSFSISFNLAAMNENKLSSKAEMAKLTGKWLAEYDDAAKMAQARANLLKDRPIQKLMNEKLSDVLSGLVKQANDQNKKDNSNLMTILDQDSAKLAQEKANYEKELAAVGANSKQTLQNAQSQIQKLQQAQDKLNQMAQKMGTDSSSSDMSDLSDLSDQADSTNKDASQDNGAFDGIYQELTGLNNSLGSIQNSGKSLNGKSMNLQKAFRNELAKSGDFAQSFINVLNAAYKNGVPNQKLLNFITNPVGGAGNEVVSERTQSYNMGMWTIVLAILAWFIAYAVENMKYFQSGKYFSKKQTKLNIHARKLVFLGIASLLSGVILAPIAAKQFPIIDSNRLLWNLSFIFLSMTLTLVFYCLMHYAKIWGTGLIIASLLNYVFNQTQFLKNVILQHLNVLGLVGNQLLSVAMFNTTNAILGLVVMGVLMIAASLVILFVPERNQEVLHEEAMV